MKSQSVIYEYLIIIIASITTYTSIRRRIEISNQTHIKYIKLTSMTEIFISLFKILVLNLLVIFVGNANQVGKNKSSERKRHQGPQLCRHLRYVVFLNGYYDKLIIVF